MKAMTPQERRQRILERKNMTQAEKWLTKKPPFSSETSHLFTYSPVKERDMPKKNK